jgi:FtsP/CotA-like multicopper oxidase with cupredoxin domain
MNRNQRIALVVAAVLVAVIAFAIVSPGGDDDDDPEQAAQTTTTGGTATAPSTDETATPDTPDPPGVTRIAIRGGGVVGGPKTITVTKGDQVRIVVTADAPDDMHLHGYDIEKEVEPGKPARFSFEANLEGQFEMESHVAEDAGRDPKVANLVVEPS